MDPAMERATRNGDVKFLREAVSREPCNYFLKHSSNKEDNDVIEGNIFHLAAWHDQADFFKEAMTLLSKDLQKHLLYEKDVDFGWTPFHVAACKGGDNHSNEIVNLIVDFYKTNGSLDGKPWLMLTKKKMTALHVALKDKMVNEKCAMEILLMDAEMSSWSMVDDHGNSPLLYALQNGFSQVAEKILTSPLATTCFVARDVLTPFHIATNCSEMVLRLLFKNYEDCIDKIDSRGYSVLHEWALKGEVGPCKFLFESDDFLKARIKVFKKLVCFNENKQRDTPLHLAAMQKDSKLGHMLIQGYQQQQLMSLSHVEIKELVDGEYPPWKIQNNLGNTPLHMALDAISKHEQLALEIISIDPTSCQIHNNMGESPLFMAVSSGCERVIDEILRIDEPRWDMLRRNDGATVLHNLSSCSEKTALRLLEKYWWMIYLPDDCRKTALDKAKQENAPWLVSLLSNPSSIQQETFDWVEACKRGEKVAVLTFIGHCKDFQRLCREENDTPLHHIKLPTSKDYVHFLKIPSIGVLKNTTDRNGSTPLHRALERKDMVLAKVLLRDEEVKRTIPDHNGTTAVDLLVELCKNDNWDKMCKQIKVNPFLKTSYIRPGTNLEQMRNTLSFVAALLATITFAAGFTLPGGVHNDTGEALLAKKAAFLVFLLADVYAMCTSMFVLFCLMWSMVFDSDMSLMLVDRSMFLLMQSLYSTLLAFMTGIFTVISHNSLWAAILIFVMCLIIGVSTNRTVLRNVTNVIVNLIPAAYIEKEDPLESLV